MKEYTRYISGSKARSFSGIVYDSVEEALASGVKQEELLYARKAWDCRSENWVGRWYVYDDGKVTQIRKEWYGGRRGQKFINTILSTFRITKTAPTLAKFRDTKGRAKAVFQTEKINRRLLKFADSWLLEGYTLEEAVKSHFWEVYIQSEERFKYNGIGRRMFAYRVLAGPWFQELLNKSRVHRDRYMSLVGTLELVGLTKDFVASQLKKAMETGSERERINALNKVLDILQADEARKTSKTILIGAQFRELRETSDEVAHIKQLEGANVSTEAVNQSNQVQPNGEEVAQDLGGEVGESQQVNRGEPSAEEVNSADQEAQVGDYDEEIQQIRQEIYAQENPPQRSFST